MCVEILGWVRDTFRAACLCWALSPTMIASAGKHREIFSKDGPLLQPGYTFIRHSMDFISTLLESQLRETWLLPLVLKSIVSAVNMVCIIREGSLSSASSEHHDDWSGPLVDYSNERTGQYVSAADAPYDQRSLPPSNLDTNPEAADHPYNYHVYKVIKEFEVLGGPIAPWFGQPGLGAQFYIGYIGNIKKLIELAYIEKMNKTQIVRGPGTPNPCGWKLTSTMGDRIYVHGFRKQGIISQDLLAC